MTAPGGNDPYSGHGRPIPHDPCRTPNWGTPHGHPPPPLPPPGAPPPYGVIPAGPVDPVSVAALVTAALCCTGPVAIVLGIVGVVRTRGARRRGRWMAVVGLIGGVLATLVLAGLAAVGLWYDDDSVTLDNAEVGQCLDIREEGDTVFMYERDCTEEHDGEVVHVGRYDESVDADASGPDGHLNTAICLDYISSTDIATLERAGLRPEDLMVIAEDPGNMRDGDLYTCYVDPGRTLTEPLLSGSPARTA